MDMKQGEYYVQTRIVFKAVHINEHDELAMHAHVQRDLYFACQIDFPGAISLRTATSIQRDIQMAYLFLK